MSTDKKVLYLIFHNTYRHTVLYMNKDQKQYTHYDSVSQRVLLYCCVVAHWCSVIMSTGCRKKVFPGPKSTYTFNK